MVNSIKTLGSVVNNTYTLAANYTQLTITTLGGVDILTTTKGKAGAAGLLMPHSGLLSNAGEVYAGAGGAGNAATFYLGTTGGTGVSISGAGFVENYGYMAGGHGGAGGTTPTFGFAGENGGNGGSGLVDGTNGYIKNYGTISGGIGGQGGNGAVVPSYVRYISRTGYGGYGGAGVIVGSHGTLTNYGAIYGGAGGAGGSAPDYVHAANTYVGKGGMGGIGGYAIHDYYQGSVNNFGTISGGKGGMGGSAVAGTAGANGVAGGAIALTGGGSVQNGDRTHYAHITGSVAIGGVGGTVTNFGAIDSGLGAAGTAVILAQGSRLIVETGSDIIGISRGGGVTSVLEFASPAAGVISDAMTKTVKLSRMYISTPTSSVQQFYNFGTLQVDARVQMNVTGNPSISSGYGLVLDGTLNGVGMLANTGSVVMGGGLLAMGELDNQGFVSGYGTVTGQVYLDQGQFFATGGKLDLSAVTLSNNAGIIGAVANSTLQMPNNWDLSILSIGAFLVGAGSQIQEYDSIGKSEVTLDAALTSITSTGRLYIQSGRNFIAAHSVVDSGAVMLNAGTFSGGALTLSGNGSVAGSGEIDSFVSIGTSGILVAYPSLTLAPANHSIVNQGVIGTEGYGYTITISQATVTNTGGTLSATGSQLDLASTEVDGGLVFSTTAGAIFAVSGANTLAMSGATILNAGQMYTYGGASLKIDHAVVNNTGGSIEVGSASTITLYDSAAYGGALRVDSGGTLAVAGAANSISLGASGTIINGGTIETTGGGALTLTGETVSNVSGVVIAGAGAGHLLLNNATVYGGKVTVAAGGAIDAQNTDVLAMAGGSITNAGTIDTLSGAHLTISQAHLNNAGGAIVAGGGGSLITLTSDTVTGAGVLATQMSGTASEILIGNASSVQAQGVLSNAGTIAVASGAANTDLRILAGGASLSGGGVVKMSGSKARILGLTAAATLTNVDNTISGTGFIGANSLTLINQSKGVIDAVGAAGLTVGTKGSTLTNQGLMEATGGGILIIANTTVANLGGTILATNGSPVDLQDDVIRGGGITASGTGVVKVNVAGGELDGTTNAVSLSGVAFIVNGSNETIEGSIANAGKINLIASTSTSDLIIGAAGATLTGGGQVNMTNSVKNRIYGLASGDTLTNVDNRIDGAGLIGDGVMTLVNDAAGQIVGNQNLALTIDTGTNIITNAGLIENVGKGGTLVKSAVNNAGILLAATAGTLNLAGAVTGAGVGQINGGTLYVQQAFAENVTFTGTTGVLELGDSQAFTGKVGGLSKTGASWLDLVDIGFFSTKTKATYSGTTASGTLTVTDGTHTAHIALQGNYTGSTWTVSGDGHGGTKVVDPSSGSAPLAQAISAFPAAPAPSHAAWTPRPPPRLMLAHAQT